MDHDDIWRAIDTLAAEKGLSVSSLARQAGLDPTTFNVSKRRTSEGRARWPGTESLARVLRATDTSLETFARLVAGERAIRTSDVGRTHLAAIDQANWGGSPARRDVPEGESWEVVPVPRIVDPRSYALRMLGHSMQPMFRDGDLIVVSPSAPVRAGDRVVVRMASGDVMVRQFLQRSKQWVDIGSLGFDHRRHRLESHDVVYVHRVVWSAQ